MSNDSENALRCHRCGAETEDGFCTASDFVGTPPSEARLVIVVPGEATSANPLRAFRQGLDDAKQNEAYVLRGRRCTNCGAVELFATEAITWEP